MLLGTAQSSLLESNQIQSRPADYQMPDTPVARKLFDDADDLVSIRSDPEENEQLAMAFDDDF